MLLGWKKNSFGLILAETSSGISKNVNEYLRIDTLVAIAENYGHANISSNELDRIEVRPDKGIVKISFKNSYTGLQIDASTGEILKVERRNSDLIEHIHDGTWFDRVFGLKSGAFKLIYTSLCGIGLVVFTLTGFWLWYGPKLIRSHHDE